MAVSQAVVVVVLVMKHLPLMFFCLLTFFLELFAMMVEACLLYHYHWNAEECSGALPSIISSCFDSDCWVKIDEVASQHILLIKAASSSVQMSQSSRLVVTFIITRVIHN